MKFVSDWGSWAGIDSPPAIMFERGFRMWKAAIVVVLMLLAGICGGVIGNLSVPRIKTKSPQPIIDVLDRDLPAPPGVTLLDERTQCYGGSGYSLGGRSLHSICLTKFIAIETDQLDYQKALAIVNHYSGFLAILLESNGIGFGSVSSKGPDDHLRIYQREEDKFVVYSASMPNVSRHIQGGDGSHVTVIAEFRDLDGRRCYDVMDWADPVRGKRVLVIQVEVEAYGFTDSGLWPSMAPHSRS